MILNRPEKKTSELNTLVFTLSQSRSVRVESGHVLLVWLRIRFRFANRATEKQTHHQRQTRGQVPGTRVDASVSVRVGFTRIPSRGLNATSCRQRCSPFTGGAC